LTGMSREHIQTIEVTIPDERQKLARYYGVHPYFTRRSANVVRTYIERFSETGDVVADPFGGSGVTAIEALLLGRRGVHNDLNPFANFVTAAVGDTTLPSTRPLRDAFCHIARTCEARVLHLESAPEAEVDAVLKAVHLPANIPLHKSSDAKLFHDLFTPHQLAGLAILKDEIDAGFTGSIRNTLLLAWSATAAMLNRTFISTKGRAASRGGSSIFSIYRYKLAKEPVELPIWGTFQRRFENVVKAKEEVLQSRDVYDATHPDLTPIDSGQNLAIYDKDAAELASTLGNESVDYIFTDPPYGGYIAYLDLSILWNHWLGLTVSKRAREAEAIVGGELSHSEEHYKQKLRESIRACTAMLRPDRWFSIVFQHWDVAYFETILQAATESGAELRTAVTQEREVIWSMHKKKNRENLLAGEMILTFYKPVCRYGASLVKETQTAMFDELLDLTLVECRNLTNVTSQFIFNRIILAAWQRRSLFELNVTKETFAEALRSRGWVYSDKSHAWTYGRIASSDLFPSPESSQPAMS